MRKSLLLILSAVVACLLFGALVASAGWHEAKDYAEGKYTWASAYVGGFALYDPYVDECVFIYAEHRGDGGIKHPPGPPIEVITIGIGAGTPVAETLTEAWYFDGEYWRLDARAYAFIIVIFCSVIQ